MEFFDWWETMPWWIRYPIALGLILIAYLLYLNVPTENSNWRHAARTVFYLSGLCLLVGTILLFSGGSDP